MLKNLSFNENLDTSKPLVEIIIMLHYLYTIFLMPLNKIY